MAVPQFKLILFYVSYLYFGAMVFYLLEPALENERMLRRTFERSALRRVLNQHLAPHDSYLQGQILQNLTNFCPDFEEPESYYETWTFYHCVFFALTIITTVGYGNIIPQSHVGRLFVIFYAVVGLPMNGIMFARFGQFYWDLIHNTHDRFKRFAHKIRLMRAIKWLIFLFPGFLFFVLLPAIVFSFFEKWTYGISIYYAFVTLTTIGFGDYAATFEDRSAMEIDHWYYCYQAFVLIWFVVGLGYVIMITQYLISHYEKSNFNQLDFEQPMSAEEEFRKFRNRFKADLRAVNKAMSTIWCCTCRCCDCRRRKAVPTESASEQVKETNTETPSPQLPLKRTQSSPAL